MGMGRKHDMVNEGQIITLNDRGLNNQSYVFFQFLADWTTSDLTNLMFHVRTGKCLKKTRLRC